MTPPDTTQYHQTPPDDTSTPPDKDRDPSIFLPLATDPGISDTLLLIMWELKDEHQTDLDI